ncbi:MAG: hypothetical protein ACTHOP_05385 [Mesorhizobium sp.]
MTKSPARSAKPAPSKIAGDGPKTRSGRKLALRVLAPLVLAGGGYAGWMLLAGAEAGAVARTADGEGGQGKDAMQVSSISTELAAETSFTHTYALSVLIAPRCGVANAPALKAASDAEAHADGMLATLSWQSAARRTAATTEKSCVFLRQEVTEGELRAMELAQKKGKTAAAH